MPKDKLKPAHQAFITEYLKNGYNAKAAYLAVRPHVSAKTAEVNGCKLLREAKIQEYIATQQKRTMDLAIASRDFLIKEAHEVAKEAREKGAYGAVFKGIELKGKLNKLFDRSEPEMDGYKNLIQMLQINVNAHAPVEEDDGKNADVIDIEKKD